MSLSFVDWWHRPIRTRDRVGAFFIGGFGGFWVGLLGRLMFGPLPVELGILGYWAVAGAIACAILGAVFPRVATVVLYPFSMFGLGIGS
jgi:hypothetical protein